MRQSMLPSAPCTIFSQKGLFAKEALRDIVHEILTSSIAVSWADEARKGLELLWIQFVLLRDYYDSPFLSDGHYCALGARFRNMSGYSRHQLFGYSFYLPAVLLAKDAPWWSVLWMYWLTDSGRAGGVGVFLEVLEKNAFTDYERVQWARAYEPFIKRYEERLESMQFYLFFMPKSSFQALESLLKTFRDLQSQWKTSNERLFNHSVSTIREPWRMAPLARQVEIPWRTSSLSPQLREDLDQMAFRNKTHFSPVRLAFKQTL